MKHFSKLAMDTSQRKASAVIHRWPSESREAAQIVIDTYGEPHEMTDSLLIWYELGPWKRIIARREFAEHNFPVPHIDAVESTLQHTVPPERHDELARFDGSITVRRTAGELSAECHDEAANFLALNLAHDIIMDKRRVEEARAYYAAEFLRYRKGEPTPYMERLRFTPNGQRDADTRAISEQELKQTKQ